MHYTNSKFWSENIAGLDFGEHSASVSLLSFGHGTSLKLKAAGTTGFGPGYDDRQIASSIRRLWKDSNLRTYTVCAGVQSSSLIFKTFSYQDLTDEEMNAAIRLDAEELLQAGQDSLCIDTHLYTADKAERRGFYIAVRKQEVDRVFRILRNAGLFPVIVDLSSMAVANLFLKMKQEQSSGRTVCVACFDGHHADIVVLSYGECTYMRSFAAHSTDQGSISTYMLENLKEIVNYHKASLDRNKIEAIYLAGDLPHSSTITEDCASETGIASETWDPVSMLHISRRLASKWKHDKEQGRHLVKSLGLALRRNA